MRHACILTAVTDKQKRQKDVRDAEQEAEREYQQNNAQKKSLSATGQGSAASKSKTSSSSKPRRVDDDDGGSVNFGTSEGEDVVEMRESIPVCMFSADLLKATIPRTMMSQRLPVTRGSRGASSAATTTTQTKRAAVPRTRRQRRSVGRSQSQCVPASPMIQCQKLCAGVGGASAASEGRP